MLGDQRPKRARRALETIADRTGGVAFLPKTADEVDEISGTVAHDIRNHYTIGYKPSNPLTDNQSPFHVAPPESISTLREILPECRTQSPLP